MSTRLEGMILLRKVVEAYLQRWPVGSVGEYEDGKRSKAVEPGDFVAVNFAMAPAEMTLGWLVEHIPHANRYRQVWVIECLDGVTRSWSNCEVYAIPLGNLYELGQGADKVRQRWQAQPHHAKPLPFRDGSGLTRITIQSKDGTTIEEVQAPPPVQWRELTDEEKSSLVRAQQGLEVYRRQLIADNLTLLEAGEAPHNDELERINRQIPIFTALCDTIRVGRITT